MSGITRKLIKASGVSGPSSPASSDLVMKTGTYTGTGATGNIIYTDLNSVSNDSFIMMNKVSSPSTSEGNIVINTKRGGTKRTNLGQNFTEGTAGGDYDLTFRTDGFEVGKGNENRVGMTHSYWQYLKHKNFLDIVQYTGGAANVPHDLGCAPGMILVKNLTRTPDPQAYVLWHKNFPEISHQRSLLSGQSSYNRGTTYGMQQVTDTYFDAGFGAEWNSSGDIYMAYVFAHDETKESVISAGWYTGNSSGQIISIPWLCRSIFIIPIQNAAPVTWWDTHAHYTVGNEVQEHSVLSTNSGHVTQGTLVMNPGGFPGIQINTGGTTYPELNSPGVSYAYLAIREGSI